MRFKSEIGVEAVETGSRRFTEPFAVSVGPLINSNRFTGLGIAANAASLRLVYSHSFVYLCVSFIVNKLEFCRPVLDCCRVYCLPSDISDIHHNHVFVA